MKAVSAASLALRGYGKHLVPLDDCIETLRQTSQAMSHKYKETSSGGLVVTSRIVKLMPAPLELAILGQLAGHQVPDQNNRLEECQSC